jgi:hypothetical protein
VGNNGRFATLRSWLLVCFAALGGCAPEHAPLTGGKPIGYWVETSRTADAAMRKEAVFKLGNAGPADPAVLPALMAALGDKDPRVRREAVLAVLKMGDSAQEAVPLLAAMEAKDGDPKTREFAAKALSKLRHSPL